MAEVAAALQGVETFLEGTVALAKGVYDPTLPLKATIVPITDVDLPRAYHSVSVIKGRAYVFGGKTGARDGAELADNAMHAIILPASGIESTDYQKLEPTPLSPPARYGHSSAIIDDSIYIFGGSDSRGPIEESGRVWVFDTTSNNWSILDPVSGDKPNGRSLATATAIDQPKPDHKPTDEDVAPQLPPDPADIVPEPLTPNTYGTFIISGGVTGSDKKPTSEVWGFDISSKTWFQLPSPPAPASPVESPSITMVDNRLYSFTSDQTHYLSLDTKSTFSSKSGIGDLGLSPLGPWTQVSNRLDSSKAAPAARSAATLHPVTTGQGRNYLLLVGGSSTGLSEATQYQDIWALQLKPTGMTAASFKDAARMAIHKNTAEEEWAEVKYYDTEDRLIQENQTGRGIGQRKGFAACKDAEIDGGSVLVWGGVEDGRIRGDGCLIQVEK